MNVLLHITTRAEWDAAQAAGEYRASSLDTEGFIHLSAPEQVLLPANTLFRGQTGLVLLVLDADRLTAPVRWEDLYNHGMEFPHLYGPLNLDAVTDVLPFEPGSDGTFTLPEGLRVAG
jgi:uncharacterized protein (DUF952 family)